MPLTFALFLEQVRKNRDLTQQEMLELLIESDTTLSKLDLTTLSRWERGVTTPKLAKQLLIARIMGADVALLIDPDAKAPIKKRNNFEQVRSRSLNPYSSNSYKFKTYHYESLTDNPELCQKLQAFHADYLGMNIEFSDFQSRNLMLEVFVDETGQLIGHLLYGFLDTSNLSSQCVPDKLSECQFILPEEHQDTNLTVYIISAYSSLASPRMTIILMILDILRKNINVKDLQVNCHDQEGYSLYESNSDCELINKGEALPFGGVKIYGKHFRYVRIKANTESILASKVVSDIVPFTSEYIQSLLNNHS
ncbi:helix-turn-helix transcriptional regulator [Vibrio coralliirubri]|uniref:helix-turn-helix transcriptional regulator n=1 Tax=Vibrio coralliirubri TaxID=1516159 RepID=UPI0022849DCB|nr:helix-turn-helix transcriptional regulator [Vibrio coralliirubri]MCY9863789.1 helix-turn-helix transcriptional regulator [Vibrio coralliirubri]